MIYGRKTKSAELAEKYRKELQAEQLPKDSPVMSSRELAEHFAVSMSTANQILNLLVEQDILYRKPKSGTFIKHDPQVAPVIAYAGPLPDRGNTNPVRYAAVTRLLKYFTELGIEPVLVSYHTLRHPELTKRQLRNVSGLLIYTSYVDEFTLPSLWNYSGKISVVWNSFNEDRISCCQVIPDFTGALLEFNQFKRFDDYDRILIVQAGHLNSAADGDTVRRILSRLQIPEKKIETVKLPVTSGDVNTYMSASRYFSQHPDLPDNTLIVGVSEYFAQAAREIFSNGKKMPDILSFDNMEAYLDDLEGEAYFTSIDRNMGLTACRALDLLLSRLNDPGAEQTILQIPAKLVIRKSVRAGSAALSSEQRKSQ